MSIAIGEDSYNLIKDDFECSELGEFDIKGFGLNTVYTLERERPHGARGY
jgi:hypothetical protein